MTNLVAAPALMGAMLLMLLTLPVTLPMAMLLERVERGRLRAAAKLTRCLRCCRTLGPDALVAADAAHMAALAAAQRRYPGHRVHVARRSRARCTICNADYAWDPKRRQLHLIPSPAEAHAAGEGG